MNRLRKRMVVDSEDEDEDEVEDEGKGEDQEDGSKAVLVLSHPSEPEPAAEPEETVHTHSRRHGHKHKKHRKHRKHRKHHRHRAQAFVDDAAQCADGGEEDEEEDEADDVALGNHDLRFIAAESEPEEAEDAEDERAPPHQYQFEQQMAEDTAMEEALFARVQQVEAAHKKAKVCGKRKPKASENEETTAEKKHKKDPAVEREQALQLEEPVWFRSPVVPTVAKGSGMLKFSVTHPETCSQVESYRPTGDEKEQLARLHVKETQLFQQLLELLKPNDTQVLHVHLSREGLHVQMGAPHEGMRRITFGRRTAFTGFQWNPRSGASSGDKAGGASLVSEHIFWFQAKAFIKLFQNSSSTRRFEIHIVDSEWTVKEYGGHAKSQRLLSSRHLNAIDGTVDDICATQLKKIEHLVTLSLEAQEFKRCVSNLDKQCGLSLECPVPNSTSSSDNGSQSTRLQFTSADHLSGAGHTCYLTLSQTDAQRLQKFLVDEQETDPADLDNFVLGYKFDFLSSVLGLAAAAVRHSSNHHVYLTFTDTSDVLHIRVPVKLTKMSDTAHQACADTNVEFWVLPLSKAV